MRQTRVYLLVNRAGDRAVSAFHAEFVVDDEMIGSKQACPVDLVLLKDSSRGEDIVGAGFHAETAPQAVTFVDDGVPFAVFVL